MFDSIQLKNNYIYIYKHICKSQLKAQLSGQSFYYAKYWPRFESFFLQIFRIITFRAISNNLSQTWINQFSNEPNTNKGLAHSNSVHWHPQSCLSPSKCSLITPPHPFLLLQSQSQEWIDGFSATAKEAIGRRSVACF